MPISYSPFESAFELFNWSKAHFDRLKWNLDEWSLKAPREWLVDQDPVSGEIRHKVRFLQRFPWEFGAAAFDVVNSQRAVLDYLMYASAVALRGGDPSGTKFPFGNKNKRSALENVHKQFSGKKRGGRFGHPNHPIILARALQMQPYEDGSRDLWALNRIRNLKHHRFLAPTSVSGGNIVIGEGFSFGPMCLTREWDIEDNAFTYLRTTGTHFIRKQGIDFSIAFDANSVVEDRLVTEFLSATGVIVQNAFKIIEQHTLGIRIAKGMDPFPLLSDNFP